MRTTLLAALVLATGVTAAHAGGPGRPGAPKPRIVPVTAHDYRFEAPDTIPAGLTTFELTNHGGELHNLLLIRLDEGKTAQDLVAALGQHALPAWAHLAGGPNAPAPHGGTANGTFVLTPGHYVLTCLIPDAKGVPHIARGMMRDLTVTPAATPQAAAAALPPADLTLTLLDYNFAWSRPLAAGRQTIRVHNAGPQPHEIVLVRLAPGKTMPQLMAWMEKMQGEPVGLPLGGVNAIEAGAEGQFTVDVAPGEYVLLCFLPDAKDGKPHVAHGMAQQIHVAAGSR